MPDPGVVLSTPPAGPAGARGAADPTPGFTDADFGDGTSSGKPAVEYKAELPADLKLPEGVEIKFNDRDPVHGEVLAEARTLAREAGLDQATFSKLLGLHAKLELRTNDVEIARRNIERGKIANFDTRSAALTKFLDANLSSEQATALKAGVTSKVVFEAIEQLISRVTGRAAPISSTPSDGKSWADRMWPDGFTKEGRPPAGRKQ
jgi:hypothetical protein